jgi:hypothetical protein
MLDALGPAVVQDILYKASLSIPSVETMIRERHTSLLQEQVAKKVREPPVNFDAKSKPAGML